MSAVAVLPGFESTVWQVRNHFDHAAVALADRHYSRRTPGSPQMAPPGRKLVLVTADEQAVWCTHWPFAHLALDGLDAWRCSIFRNESDRRSSELITEAMELTARLWTDRPKDGWVTWVDKTKIASAHPGYCFKQAGWTLDREWQHRRLIRLRSELVPAHSFDQVEVAEKGSAEK